MSFLFGGEPGNIPSVAVGSGKEFVVEHVHKHEGYGHGELTSPLLLPLLINAHLAKGASGASPAKHAQTSFASSSDTAAAAVSAVRVVDPNGDRKSNAVSRPAMSNTKSASAAFTAAAAAGTADAKSAINREITMVQAIKFEDEQTQQYASKNAWMIATEHFAANFWTISLEPGIHSDIHTPERPLWKRTFNEGLYQFEFDASVCGAFFRIQRYRSLAIVTVTYGDPEGARNTISGNFHPIGAKFGFVAPRSHKVLRYFQVPSALKITAMTLALRTRSTTAVPTKGRVGASPASVSAATRTESDNKFSAESISADIAQRITQWCDSNQSLPVLLTSSSIPIGALKLLLSNVCIVELNCDGEGEAASRDATAFLDALQRQLPAAWGASPPAIRRDDREPEERFVDILNRCSPSGQPALSLTTKTTAVMGATTATTTIALEATTTTTSDMKQPAETRIVVLLHRLDRSPAITLLLRHPLSVAAIQRAKWRFVATSECRLVKRAFPQRIVECIIPKSTADLPLFQEETELKPVPGSKKKGGSYKAVRTYTRPNGVTCAVAIPHSQETEGVVKFKREMQFAARLRSKYVVSIVGHVDLTNGDFGTIMEYLPDDLETPHSRARKRSLVEKVALAVDIFECFQFLHSRGVVHSDVKPSNIRLTAESKPKLIDFGFSQICKSSTAASTSLTKGYTENYCSPERFTNVALVTYESDVYSLGVVLFELLTDRDFAKEYTGDMRLWLAIASGWRPAIPMDVPRVLCDLIESMWHQTPSSRPTICSAIRQLIRTQTTPSLLSDFSRSPRQQLDHKALSQAADQFKRAATARAVGTTATAAAPAVPAPDAAAVGVSHSQQTQQMQGQMQMTPAAAAAGGSPSKRSASVAAIVATVSGDAKSVDLQKSVSAGSTQTPNMQ